MVTETGLELPGGRTLHVYDTAGDGGEDRLTVFWHHGTPNLGPPPEPLFPAADRLGIRWVSYDRPGYGGSTPRPGRDLASAANDVAGIGDALGIGRFAGHSGGSNHPWPPGRHSRRGGVRPGGGPRAGAGGARRPGPGRAQQPRPVAGRPDPSAELWRGPEDGHVPVLGSAEAALGWLREDAGLG